ncbi:putative LRR receptor-like serine/threonine-protein kinase [Senna tora]|uniref:non-specific serine/threonine protein kinase n=1 Tax=Senna tora TaxID=362788 RepID=A0A834TKQ7_9FABA|nr:putative LRR receptor-like serine/threonine-protein kinase [Senna tora]
MGFVVATSKLVSLFFFGFLAFTFFSHFGSNAQLIPLDEVKALQAISDKLKNVNWNITERSCIDGQGFNNTLTLQYLIERNVSCVCTFQNDTVCHVTNIDLNRNYLNGPIPTIFTRIPILVLNLIGNRLTGSIPTEFGDIVTLVELTLEGNQLEGSLPPSLGNLSNLKELLLSANNFTGTIPETFVNLKNLTDLKDSKFYWELDQHYHTGTGMEGPIPSTISSLTNLKELVLRNCLITGDIKYIGELTTLKTLDLSFNMLNGSIDSFLALKTDQMILTNNSLSGAIAYEDLNTKNNIDLSYNNFTESTAPNCQIEDLNLASSLSSSANNSLFCLKKGLPCAGKPKYHSLFIDCGGGGGKIDGEEYEADLDRNGVSNFVQSNDKWGYSSSGTYMYKDQQSVVATNTFSLNIEANDSNPQLYQTARLSAVSLKYYGFCLRKGNYKVKLHFAEIMFSHDQTYSSLGRRFFDVSIQGVKYLEDYNIAERAGGVGKGITEEFNVDVNDSTLEIHLYWAGKGTNGIPNRSVYGPLISAISVTPNFKIPSKGLSAGAIVGIVAGSCVFLALILFVLRKKGYLGGKKDITDKELLDLKIGYFSLRQIKAATGDFARANKIGEGGFGPVYKGVLPDGTMIAVKQLSSKSKQGNREFVNEIGMISALQHPNLVKLFGCCIEGNQLMLIYEYLENNCLARALFGKCFMNTLPKDECVYLLDWAYVLQEKGKLLELVDPSLGSNYSEMEAMRMLNMALLCTNASPTLRPSMSSVVSMLEGKTPIQTPISKRSDSSLRLDARFKALELLSRDSQTLVSSTIFSQESVERSGKSMDGPWTDSTISLSSRDEFSSSNRLLQGRQASKPSHTGEIKREAENASQLCSPECCGSTSCQNLTIEKVIISHQLTQAKGLRHSMDINSHLLCFDHTAGQRECIPFWQSKNCHVSHTKAGVALTNGLAKGELNHGQRVEVQAGPGKEMNFDFSM